MICVIYRVGGRINTSRTTTGRGGLAAKAIEADVLAAKLNDFGACDGGTVDGGASFPFHNPHL